MANETTTKPEGWVKVGQVVAARYTVERCLATRGDADLYQVADALVGERVVLKLLRPSSARAAQAVQRFRAEVQLARKITHAHVCRIYDAGVYASLPYCTMELLEGETLKTLLERAVRLLEAEAVELARQITAGLVAAHRAGVVHRNLTSDAIVLARTPGEPSRLRAVITDFGVAGAVHPYMAPELLEGREIGPATDIYAVGALLYEMVTGQLPFGAANPVTAARLRLVQAPVPPRVLLPAIDPRLDRVVLRCLERSPADRYESADELGLALVLAPLEAPDEGESRGIGGEPKVILDEAALAAAPAEDREDDTEPDDDTQPEDDTETVREAAPGDRTDIVILDRLLAGHRTRVATGVAATLLVLGWLVVRPRPASWRPESLGATAGLVAALVPRPAPAPTPPSLPPMVVPLLMPPERLEAAPAAAPAQATKAKPKPDRPERAPRDGTRRARPAATGDEGASEEQDEHIYGVWLDEARDAYAGHRFARALRRAGYALEIHPRDPEALSIAAMAACQLGRTLDAERYLEGLRGERLEAVRRLCLNVQLAAR